MNRIPWLAAWLTLTLTLASSAESPPGPPPIAAQVTPKEYRSLLEERAVLSHARLETLDERRKRYSFSASMQVRAGLELTRGILTDYRIYSKLIPYIERADYKESERILDLEGGIWKFRLHSLIEFEQRGERWISYRVVAGHFQGLQGSFQFESLGEAGTLVHFKGEIQGTDFPPRFVIERGAEIVFGFTARRMRSYVESNKGYSRFQDGKQDPHTDSLTPVPRSRPLR